MRRAVLFVWLAGCGRFGVDDQAITRDAPIDVGADATACTQSGLITHLTFDGDAFDHVSLTIQTSAGGVSYVTTPRGRGLHLDGIDGIVQLAVPPVSDFTVAAWVQTTDVAPGTPGELWYVGTSIVDNEQCGFPQGGDWGLNLITGGHVVAVSAQSPIEINDGAWHLVVRTRGMVLDDLKIYIDGALAISDSGGIPGTTHQNQPWVGIGNNPCAYPNGRFFEGTLDELWIFDRVITAAERAELAACPP